MSWRFRASRKQSGRRSSCPQPPPTTEDWVVSDDGSVSDFFAAGLINATRDEHYGTDEAFEVQYAPGGIGP